MFSGVFMLFWFIIGCATELRILTDQPGCEDVDFNEPTEELIQYLVSDVGVEVSHTNTETYCDAVFEPEFISDGNVIEVYEYWSTPEDTSCTTCFSPRIVIQDPPPGVYEVRWYIGDDAIPFDIVEIGVD